MPSPSRRKSPSPAALGTHLEWHGRSIRVRVKVPPSRREAVGKAWLKETLPTNDPREAELLKWPVIGRLKNTIAGVKTEDDRTNRDREALAWKEAIDHEARQLEDEGIEPWRATLPLALTDKAEQIEATEGEAVARAFVDVASGTATPLQTLVDDWLKEREVSGRTEQAFRYAVKQLALWCGEADVPQTVQAIDRRTAGRFVQQRFTNQGTDPGTANKTITGLKSYWTWLIKRGHIEGDGSREASNPWEGQRLGKKKRRGEAGEPSKRPFTDAEVSILVAGTARKQRLGDFVNVAALTGMRRDEIANLKVKHIADGVIRVLGTKTDAALRDVPVHPDLTDLLKRRSTGKSANDFIFDELPEQTSDARGRGAPITQEFTRDRRELGVEDKEEGARQSRIDLHSFRRWFIKKAVAALEDGATGFTAWTIADVVDEIDFNDALTMNLRRGRFLLLIVGDGIRVGVETIVEYLQGHSGLHFTLGLVELPVYRLEDGARIVVPRVLAKTQSVLRTVVEVPDGFAVRGNEDEEAQELAETPERSAGRKWRSAIRHAFWKDFLAGLRLDDPDQQRPPASMGGHVVFKFGAPGGSSWLTVYRDMRNNRVGLFLSSNVNSVGERAAQELATYATALAEELGPGATIDFTQDRPEIADELSVLDLEDPADRTRALEWLQDRTNAFVNALRPRIRSILRDLAAE